MHSTQKPHLCARAHPPQNQPPAGEADPKQVPDRQCKEGPSGYVTGTEEARRERTLSLAHLLHQSAKKTACCLSLLLLL
jgi:hypothetical protein